MTPNFYISCQSRYLVNILAIESYQTSLRYLKIENLKLEYFNLREFLCFLSHPIFVRMVPRGNAVSENAK